jgi:hypothetical protein
MIAQAVGIGFLDIQGQAQGVPFAFKRAYFGGRIAGNSHSWDLAGLRE